MMAGSSWYLLFLYLCQNLILAGAQDELRPLLYKLSLLTQVDEAKMEGTFSGDVTIHMRVFRETDKIILSSNSLKVDPKIVLIRKNTGFLVTVRKSYYIVSQDRLGIEFKTRLFLGEEYGLTLKFSGRLTQTPRGYFLGSYRDEDDKQQWMTLTEVVPSMAGRIFPCFEDPSLLSPIALQLAHRQDMQAMSHMPVSRTSRHARKDYMWTIFDQTPPISVHKLTFSVNALKEVKFQSVVPNGPTLKFWVGTRIEGDEGNYAMRISSQLMYYIGDLYNVSYPLKQINVMVLRDGIQQSPEYLGLVGLPERYFLYSEEHSTVVAKQAVATRLAQVLTHHWLVNLISYDTTWIADGLSDYIATFAVDHVEPTWRQHRLGIMRKAFLVLQEDSVATPQPLTFTASLGAETPASRKAVILFRMLHSLVGTQVFVTSLKSYLKRAAMGNSSRTLLWEIFQDEADREMRMPPEVGISQLMSSWSMLPGYPVLRVIRNYDTGQVNVTQEQFLRNPGHGQIHRRQCWWVPLTFTRAEEHNFQPSMPPEWLQCGLWTPTHSHRVLTDVAPSEEWVLFNLHLTTPCRVTYDKRNWRLLDEELGSNPSRIDAISRAQILDDALALAAAGLVTYDLAFTFLRHLPREDEVIVWHVAALNLEWLCRHLQTTPISPVIKIYMHSLLESKFGELFRPGEVPKEETSSSTMELKRIVLQLSCQSDLVACERLALMEFRGLNATTNRIPMDLRGVLYCKAIRLGTEADWILLRKIYDQSKDARERSIILSALACSLDNWALENMLQWIFTSRNMSREDVLRVFSTVVQSPLGYSLAKHYLVNNIKAMRKFYDFSTKELAQLLTPLMEEIYTELELDFMDKFMKSQLKDMNGIEPISYRLRELAQYKIAWHKYRYQEVVVAICKFTDSLLSQCF